MIRRLLKPGRQQSDAPEVQVSMDGEVPRLVNWSGRTFLVERVVEAWTVPENSEGLRRAYVRALTGEGELLLYRSSGRWYLDAVSVDSEGSEILGVDRIEKVVSAIQEIQQENERISASNARGAGKRYRVNVIVPYSRK